MGNVILENLLAIKAKKVKLMMFRQFDNLMISPELISLCQRIWKTREKYRDFHFSSVCW